MQYFLHSPTVALLATVLAGDLAAALPGASSSPSSSSSAPAATGSIYASGFDITTSWANLCPYKEADGFNISKGVPHGCELSQVHILHRHAQRNPTSSYLDGGGMEAFAAKLKNYTATHGDNKTIASGPLSFLNDWEYMLGEDTLLVSGAATEAAAGAEAWAKYGRLLYRAKSGFASWDEKLNVWPNGTARPKPVFRTTSQARILESARWWLSGFFGNSGADSSYDQYDLVVIPEVEPFNNTLASYDSCPGDSREGYQGDNTVNRFIPKFTHSALTRLTPYLPRDFNFTSADILAMLNLCPYETATYSSGNTPTSPFCTIFTEQEWLDYAYNIGIEFYGDYGLGSSTGRAQGIGYVLELAARLQGKLIHESDTSINNTYDNNEKQFPPYQPLYMDMSHENIIISVLTALGLEYFKYGPNGLPATNNGHAPEHTFHLNKIAPFGARLAFEIWSVPANSSTTALHHLEPVLYHNPDLSSTSTNKTQPKTKSTDYIRLVLNGAPVPLTGLPGCQEQAVNGFCPVSTFLNAMPKLKDDAEYQFACFGKHDRGGRQVGEGRPQ